MIIFLAYHYELPAKTSLKIAVRLFKETFDKGTSRVSSSYSIDMSKRLLLLRTFLSVLFQSLLIFKVKID